MTKKMCGCESPVGSVMRPNEQKIRTLICIRTYGMQHSSLPKLLEMFLQEWFGEGVGSKGE